jgi:hypothetical protein
MQPELQLTGSELPDISFADLHEVAFQLFMDLGAHTKVSSAAAVRLILLMRSSHVTDTCTTKVHM